MGNSLGRAPWGRNETEATIGCTEEKPWEIAWGELHGGRSNDEMVDGGETLGNSLGRAPVRRSDMEATREWTGGNPWEIAWGELRWAGGKERYGSDERREAVGNSLGRAPRWEGAIRE